MSGPARASADRGPRSARQGGVYSLHTRGRRALCLGAVCLAGLLMAACMHTVLSEPAGFSGTPRSPAPASPSPPQLTGDPDRPYLLQTQPPYTVALDAGHGGFDTGAEAIIKELEVCEQTVNALYTLLEQDSNYAPVRTRPNGEDRSIKERAQAATDAGASLLLSVHANSDESTGQSHGFECFPTPPGRTYSEESMRFAQCIAQKMGGAGHRLRGENGIRFAYYNGKSKRIVDSTDTKIREQKSFGIVERPYCPAVLVEQCFLTNYSDVENWTGEAGCARAARIYYEAICAFFGPEPLPLGGCVGPPHRSFHEYRSAPPALGGGARVLHPAATAVFQAPVRHVYFISFLRYSATAHAVMPISANTVHSMPAQMPNRCATAPVIYGIKTAPTPAAGSITPRPAPESAFPAATAVGFTPAMARPNRNRQISADAGVFAMRSRI